MDCNYFKELLSAYIDNYIMPNEKLELEKHLLECSSCKEYLLKLRNYKNDLKNFEELEPPAGFEKKVMNKIEEMKKPFSWSFSQKFILEISAFLIVFASLFLVYISIGKQKEKTTPSVISEEKMKKTEKKIEIGQKKEFDKNEDFESKKQEKVEKLGEMKDAQSSIIIPAEKKKITKLPNIPIESYKEKSKEKIKKELKKEEIKKEKELLQEAVPEEPAPILCEEKKASAPFKPTNSLVIPIYRITIKISEENFKDSLNKIEEILKNEKIDFKKVEVNEYKEEILIPSKDFKNIIKKIANIEGVKVINYNQNQVFKSREIKIELLKE